MGLCMICGQPMGLKTQKGQTNFQAQLSFVDEEQDYDERDYQVVNVQDGFANLQLRSNEESEEARTSHPKSLHSEGNLIESMLLIEECPIRMAFLRFNMLGEQQDCHIIDQYTFLEKKIKDECFVQQLREHEQIIKTIDKDGCFSSFVSFILGSEASQSPTILEKALATCKRMGDQFLFAGCRRCNMYMNKPIFHVDTIYRCFSPTSQVDNTLLESRSAKAIKIKKVIQQIAFYFKYVADTDPNHKTKKHEWKNKTPEEILLDVNIWRCISSLCCWGVFKKYRFRLIAIFHASYFLYMNSSAKPFFTFEDWHIHFFRERYMDTYASSTFFGLEEHEIQTYFNLSTKQGGVWIEMITTRLLEFQSSVLEPFYKIKDFDRIYTLKEKIERMIFNEFTLILFLSSKSSMDDGIARFLDFFSYNLQGANNATLTQQCIRFQKVLCSTVRQEKLNRRQQQAAAASVQKKK